jgi:hypothetical protein
MRLPSAAMHLRRRHLDCLSCSAEYLMVKSMIEGRGYFFEGDIFAHTATPRQES